MTYAFIAAYAGEFSVNRMCEVLKVSRSGYYDWLKREPSQRQARLIIFEHIEVWYNRQRLHSSLGYLSPAAFEQRPYETNTVR